MNGLRIFFTRLKAWFAELGGWLVMGGICLLGSFLILPWLVAVLIIGMTPLLYNIGLAGACAVVGLPIVVALLDSLLTGIRGYGIWELREPPPEVEMVGKRTTITIRGPVVNNLKVAEIRRDERGGALRARITEVFDDPLELDPPTTATIPQSRR